MTKIPANKNGAVAPLPHAEPEAAGMSSARLARIVTALNEEIAAGQLPGAVVAVARHGHLVFHEAVGHLGPDRSAPMPKDALFGDRLHDQARRRRGRSDALGGRPPRAGRSDRAVFCRGSATGGSRC